VKSFSLLTLVLIISLAFYSCKKSNADSAEPTTSSWTLMGVSYAGDSNSYKGDSSYYAFINGAGVDSTGFFANTADMKTMISSPVQKLPRQNWRLSRQKALLHISLLIQI
jgi:hypothetical protein